MSDKQDRVALAYGKAIIAHMNAGSTLAQALNQAYADVNPGDNPKIRLAIVASLVGLDLDTPPVPVRFRFQDEDQGAPPPPGP